MASLTVYAYVVFGQSDDATVGSEREPADVRDLPKKSDLLKSYICDLYARERETHDYYQ